MSTQYAHPFMYDARSLMRWSRDFSSPESEQAVRQIVHRARKRVRTDRSRVHVEPERGRRLLDGFLAALAADDRDALLSMFTNEATFTSDGGGKVSATVRIVAGRDRVARMFRGVEAKWGDRFEHRLGEVNGEPGILTYADGHLFAVTAFEIVDGRIANVHRVMNPDKLRFANPGGAKAPPLPT